MSERLYFEDFPAGETVAFDQRYPVTREEIVEFAREYDPQPMHLTEEGGAESIFGGLAASGWWTCALAMRAISDGYISQSECLGSPGIDEGKWLRPVHPGDVLRLTRECVEARRSRSRPEMGICTFHWVLYDQNDEPVLDMIGKQMFLCRDTADGQAAP